MTSPPRGVTSAARGVTSAAPAVTSSSGGVSAAGGESDMVVPARSAEESFIRFLAFKQGFAFGRFNQYPSKFNFLKSS